MPRDAGAVRKHVVQGDGVVQLVVIKLNGRHGLPDGLVPGELAFLDEHTRGDRREELGVGGDGTEGGGSERQFLLVIAVAVAFGEDKLVVDDDAYTDARRVPILQHLFHVGIEAGQLLGDFGGLGGDAVGQGHGEQGDCGDPAHEASSLGLNQYTASVAHRGWWDPEGTPPGGWWACLDGCAELGGIGRNCAWGGRSEFSADQSQFPISHLLSFCSAAFLAYPIENGEEFLGSGELSGRALNGRVRKTLLPEDKDSTATTEIRLTECCWALVFNGSRREHRAGAALGAGGVAGGPGRPQKHDRLRLVPVLTLDDDLNSVAPGPRGPGAGESDRFLSRNKTLHALPLTMSQLSSMNDG